MSVNLEDCLPGELRGTSTTFTRMAAGLSGAGVHRVETAGGTFVLKLSLASEPLADWRRKLHAQRQAAAANLAPAIVHIDESRRAVLSAFVVDQSFPARYYNPRTHEAALAELGGTLRRVHELPPPVDAAFNEPRIFLADYWAGLTAGFSLPEFVRATVERVLAEIPPPRVRELVLSHNDVNPTNLVHDGTRLLLLDWEMAGLNDPLYDLATISLFLRMDDETCRKLLGAHDGEAPIDLPARFHYQRRLVAVLVGTVFLHLARGGGHPGATGAETLDAAPALIEIYQRMQAGTLNPATPDGQWALGLAMVKISATLR
jgi:aminoglycoside phosphotransferase (APT) family kinase protein